MSGKQSIVVVAVGAMVLSVWMMKPEKKKKIISSKKKDRKQRDERVDIVSRKAAEIAMRAKSKEEEAALIEQEESNYKSEWSEHLPGHILREQYKERRRKEKLPILAMKSQMYDNITMFCPEGRQLSQISYKKAKWYVQKQLATWIGEDNKAIRLTFEPKARSDEGDYGRSLKQNICIACGDDEKYQMRFYIVPHVYRTLFPKRYKTHMSHDVVLLCSDCHLIMGTAANNRMNEIEDEFNPQKRFATNQRQYKVRSAALALLNWRHKIPEQKISDHEATVRQYLTEEKTPIPENDLLTNETLQRIKDVDHRIENPNYIPGPVLVVNSIVNDQEKMADFIRSWRRFFVNTIHPRFLPDGWSIDYAVACDEKPTS